jgi:hypothetical protein
MASPVGVDGVGRGDWPDSGSCGDVWEGSKGGEDSRLDIGRANMVEVSAFRKPSGGQASAGPAAEALSSARKTG